jgi:hypothetical protein
MAYVNVIYGGCEDQVLPVYLAQQHKQYINHTVKM